MISLKTIEIDVETFLKDSGTKAEHFAAVFANLFKRAPAGIQVVENFVNEAAPYITEAVDIADPAADGEVAAALATIEVGLAGIESAAEAIDSGTSLLASLKKFKATVPTLLSSLDVKNPLLTAAIEKVVNFVTNELTVIIPAVEALVAKAKASANPPAPAAATA